MGTPSVAQQNERGQQQQQSPYSVHVHFHNRCLPHFHCLHLLVEHSLQRCAKTSRTAGYVSGQPLRDWGLLSLGKSMAAQMTKFRDRHHKILSGRSRHFPVWRLRSRKMGKEAEISSRRNQPQKGGGTARQRHLPVSHCRQSRIMYIIMMRLIRATKAMMMPTSVHSLRL